MDGRPFEGATVQFIAVGQTLGHGGAGVTDAAGQYKLRGAGGEGLPPGEYKVVVSRMVLPDGKPLPEGAAPANEGARETVPPRFSNPDITVLKATVPSGGSPALDFPLHSK